MSVTTQRLGVTHRARQVSNAATRSQSFNPRQVSYASLESGSVPERLVIVLGFSGGAYSNPCCGGTTYKKEVYLDL